MNISPLVRAWYAGIISGARYGIISNNGKTITVVTFGSVDAIGADEIPSNDRRIARTISGNPITVQATAAPVQRNDRTMPMLARKGPKTPLRPSRHHQGQVHQPVEQSLPRRASGRRAKNIEENVWDDSRPFAMAQVRAHAKKRIDDSRFDGHAGRGGELVEDTPVLHVVAEKTEARFIRGATRKLLTAE